ncbi:MAG: hypothetical protein OEY51_06665, partial [Cyclobacteriaceae bacterium]|nr:hypothetical protein [Cyclobacteriaceae bacterium]
YDIFISYRQKDNLPAPGGNGWVTDFVQALKNELESVFKEDISIYFDINPHDGLHESHDVDGSLEEKIKCLVFIPILSRTYCDPKSFAWSKELLPFLEFAKNDGHGLKIKLTGGNVAGRVLPVRVHDLDRQDVELFEKETDGVLRSIDFVYKETGVNRALDPADSRDLNLNKTDFRNQVNKVAMAIKDLVEGMKTPADEKEKTKGDSPKEDTGGIQASNRTASGKVKVISLALFALLALSALFYWFYLQKEAGTVERINKSLAVLPFQSLNSSEDDKYFADGLTEELINTLSGIPDLRVTGRTSSFYFKDKNSSLDEIANTLRVEHVLEGSVRKSEDSLRVTVQFVRIKDGETLWSQAYKEPLKNVLTVQTSIAENISRALNIVLDEVSASQMSNLGVRNVEAFVAFQKGYELFRMAHSQNIDQIEGLQEANRYFDEAIALAPNLSQAYHLRSDLFGHLLLDSAGLSASQIEKLFSEFRTNLENAVKYSKDKGGALLQQSDLVFFSEDWSSLPEIIAQLVASGTCERPNWIQNSLYTQSQHDPSIPAYLEDRISCDPLREENYGMAALAYVNAGDADRALGLLDEGLKVTAGHSSGQYLYELKILILRAKGEKEKALDIIHLLAGEDYKKYQLALQAAFQGDSARSFEIWKSLPVTFDHYLETDLVINALNGRREEANRIAALIDQQPYGPIHLNTTVRYCLCGSPFDLEFTPNFSMRIKESGLSWPPASPIRYPLKKF